MLPFEKITNPAARSFKDNLINYEGQAAFLLADGHETGHGRSIMVTQNDIRELQLAIGNYLIPRSACLIELIPQELEGKIAMIGNAAGTGVKQALLLSGKYLRSAEVAYKVNFVELGSYPRFNGIFAECMYFNYRRKA